MSEEPTPQLSKRGFKHMDPVPSSYGGYIRAYESSAATAPHIWVRTVCPANLNDRFGATVEAVAHLTLPNAIKLRSQLDYLIEHHYQVEQS